MKQREIPKYLISRRYISALIALIVAFSSLYMVLYKPLSLAVWFSLDQVLNFSFTLLFYIAAIVVLILSRSLMYSLQDRVELTVVNYLWWIMGESLIISLIYTLITINFFPLEGVSTPLLATRALMCVTCILLLPNVFVSFYAAYKAKCEEYDAISYQFQRLSEEYRLLEMEKRNELIVAKIVGVDNKKESAPKMINFYDNSGVLRLTVNVDALYYLESEDNYITIYYKHNEKMHSYMLRCRTRSVERSLEGTCMVRCHRSFIVNINKIRVMGENRRMHFLTLDDEQVSPIPVSKSYYQSLLSSLNTSTAQPKDGVSVADGTES